MCIFFVIHIVKFILAQYRFNYAIIFALVTALIGCIVMGLALFGWGFRNLNAVERIILLPCSVMLILPKPLIANLIGGGISLVILGLAFIQSRRVHSVVQTDE